MYMFNSVQGLSVVWYSLYSPTVNQNLTVPREKRGPGCWQMSGPISSEKGLQNRFFFITNSAVEINYFSTRTRVHNHRRLELRIIMRVRELTIFRDPRWSWNHLNLKEETDSIYVLKTEAGETGFSLWSSVSYFIFEPISSRIRTQHTRYVILNGLNT